MVYAVAVLDIGMTNKKILIYDDKLNELESIQRIFPPPEIKGYPVHDMEGITEWFFQSLKELGKKYPVRVISVTTHGATFVCIGEDGRPSVPNVLYTVEPGEEFHREFFEKVGDPLKIQITTVTPNLNALINPAKGIFFAQKTFPEEFKNTKWILLYPQYFGYILTGNIGAEPTYMAPHISLESQEA